MPQAVDEIINKYRKIVWSEAKKYIKDADYPKKLSVPDFYQEEKDYHWRLVRNYPERQGKYIRPILLLLACEAMGGKISKALKTAAAMQISEDWLLIHDDFEDGSLERRGRPTLHRIYGSELAVNAGDALHVIMWKILSDNLKVLGPQKTHLIIDEFYRILTRTVLGQSTEIRWARENKLNFSDKDWFFIADGKTSYYTVAGPLRLGAIVAGASEKQLESLTLFGLYLGRCYQLVDDILDLTSDFAGLKKQKGHDILEGKRTVMLGHLLRNAKGDDKSRLLRILKKSKDKRTKQDVRWIIQKMTKYGSIAYTRGLAEKLKKKASAIFYKQLMFIDKEPARKNLEDLIDFILERTY